MTSTATDQTGGTRGKRRVLVASFVGTAIEWYDFFIFGTAASLVFGKLFFSEAGEVGGTLAALATFGVGFAARPIGAIVCGHFGDRVGRKAMLVATLVTMGLATFLVGILPTYDQIGVWAPIALVVLRLAQGFAVGGEWGGAVLMAVEHSPDNRRGLYGCIPQLGAPAGLFLATVAFSLVSMLPEEDLMTWGWRLPFITSIVLVLVGLIIRLKVAESPSFTKVRDSGTVAKVPLLDAIRQHPRGILIAAGARVGETVQFYIAAVFVITYAAAVSDLSRSQILIGILIAAGLELVTLPLFARLTDSIGRRPVYIFGAVASIILAYPFFLMVDSGSAVLTWLAITLGLAVCHSAMFAPQAAYFSELFGARTRYSGASFGNQVTGAIVGGFTPLVAAAIMSRFDDAALPLALYIIGFSSITIVALYFANETFRNSGEAIDEAGSPTATSAPAAAEKTADTASL